MNLHAIAVGVISAVNPQVPAILLKSTGYIVAPDGSSSPTYQQQEVLAQIQAMTGGDLRQIEGLNLNGVMRSAYLYGVANAAVRVESKGGDLISMVEHGITRQWLIARVLEQWPNWVKCVISLQDSVR